MRVLISDDHPLVRDMVRFACEEREGLEVVGEAADGIETLEQCRALQPDVLVLDLILPRLGGVDVARQLHQETSSVRILVLTGVDEPHTLFQCIRAGVHGYLEKSVPIEEVAAAIEAVASGTRVFSVEQERMAQAELADLVRRTRETAKVISTLTRREREVLNLIANGLSTRQMASGMQVSERTVETHVANVYHKLQVRTRVEAVYRAASLGLVDLANGPQRGVEPAAGHEARYADLSAAR